MGKRNQKKPWAVDQLSEDSEDEEIDEDEAFNSDDERKYGSFFAAKGDDDAESSEGGDSSDDDDEDSDNDDSSDGDSKEGDGGQYMLDLLNKLDDRNDDKGDGKKVQQSMAPHVKESQFASSVIPNAGLTLDSLMEGLKDTKGFGVVQKTMKNVAQGQATPAPLAKVVSDRAQRKVHYEIQSKEVSQWSHAVQENRRAETLDFRPKQRLEVTRDMMIDQFVPTTDFEKQIHAALQAAGQEDDEAMLKAEEDALHDDLGANDITLEEFKKRRGQLAKMRALMFYHEQKRHHINKIKSRKYRRIRKNQREKMKGAEVDAQIEDDPDLARELEEKEEVERMKERASLAHKNTSKWAKRILKRGKNVDVDTRRALSAQIKRGDDLLKRMNSTRAGEEDDDEEEDLVETARIVLANAENDDDDDNAVQGKGLFQLSFMKRGIEKQRERAKQEARQLLMELEADDGDYCNSDNEEDKKQSPRKKVKVASKAEMKHVLNDGELVASALKFGTSGSIAVSGGINIDAGFLDGKIGGAASDTRVSVHSAIFSTDNPVVANESATNMKTARPSTKKSKPSVTVPPVSLKEPESNPWLASVTRAVDDTAGSPPAKHSAAKFAKRHTKRSFVDVDRAVDLLESTPPPASTLTAAVSNGSAPAAADKRIIMLTQDELLQRAFATQSAHEVDEEFAKEKALVEGDEDPTRRPKKETDMGTASGWGSWAGQGAPPANKAPRQLPPKLQAPEKKVVKRQRADAKKANVIISAKRVKKMADQYMLSTIPYPYTSREDYERSMAGGVGREWNVTDSFKAMTRPDVMTRAGKMIQPLSQKVKHKRAPAKF